MLRKKYQLYVGTIDDLKAWDKFLKEKGVKIHNYITDRVNKVYVINIKCTRDEFDITKATNLAWTYGWC